MRALTVLFIILISQLSLAAIDLGQGKVGENWTPRCVDGPLQYGGGAVGAIKISHEMMNSEQILRTLSKAKAGVDLGIFGASGKLEIRSLVHLGRTNWYFVAEYEVAQKVESFLDPYWNDFGKEVLALEDKEAFKNLCGETYVHQLVRKKRLYLVLRFKFNKKLVRNDLKLKVKVKVLGGSITKTYKTRIQAGSELEKVEVFAVGEGFDMEPFMGPIRDQMKNCGKNNVEACDQAANLVFKTISDDEFLDVMGRVGGAAEPIEYKNYDLLLERYNNEINDI